MRLALHFLSLVLVASATVTNLPDAAQATFNSAVAAASPGDTIVFPLNGSATWSASSTVSKALTIDGNGTTLTAGAALGNGFIYVTNFTSSALMRITGFTFNAVGITANRHCLYFGNSLALTNLRVDHNTFHNGEIQVEVGGCSGVFDNNYFYNGNSAIYPSAGSRAQADASWSSMAAGTGEALFFENNQFIYNGSWLGANEHNACFDTNNGGKFVVRFNTFTATAVPSSWTGPFTPFLSHGNAPNGGGGGYWQESLSNRRGQSVVEIYGNTAIAKRLDFAAQIRGSANLIYSNSFTTQTAFSDTPAILAYEEEQYVVSFSPLRTAWPAEDQVHNTFVWNNLFLGGATSPNPNYFKVADTSTDYIQQNRDYFLHAPASTGGYEYFTGLNGASNTYPTNSYGNGTMAFSSSGPNAYYGYSPYQYPHPLTVPPPTLGVKPARSVAGMSF